MEIIGIEKLLLRVIPILEKLDINYYVTGGFAVSAWGRPRSTLDIDIVVKVVEPKVAALAQALRKISEFGYIDEDAAQEAIRQKDEFNFIDSDSGYKVDFWVMKDEESAREYSRRLSRVIEGQKVYFASPEDLILSKLRWYQQSESDRHLGDIASVFKSCGRRLDKKYLKLWADKLNVSELLRRFIPD